MVEVVKEIRQVFLDCEKALANHGQRVTLALSNYGDHEAYDIWDFEPRVSPLVNINRRVVHSALAEVYGVAEREIDEFIDTPVEPLATVDRQWPFRSSLSGGEVYLAVNKIGEMNHQLSLFKEKPSYKPYIIWTLTEALEDGERSIN